MSDSSSSSESMSSLGAAVTSWLGFNNVFDSNAENIRQCINNLLLVCSSLKRTVEDGESDQVLNAILTVLIDTCEQPRPDKLRDALGKSGALLHLSQILSGSGRNVEVLQSTVQVCSLLSENQINRSRMVAANIHEGVLFVMKSKPNDANIAEWGCKFIKNLSNDDSMLVKLAALGSCEVVVSVLEKHHTSNRALEAACRAIFALCMNSPGNRNKVGSAGAANAVVNNILKKHLELHKQSQAQRTDALETASETIAASVPISFDETESTTMLECGLRVVSVLTRNHKDNTERFIALGMCKLLHDLYCRYTENNAVFMTAFLSVSAQLANGNANYQNELSSHGMSDIILAAMAKYTEAGDVRVVQECYRALRNLCHENDSIQNELLSKSASAKVVLSIQRFGKYSEVAAQWGWYCVASLAMHHPNLQILVDCGGCTELVSSLTNFRDSEEVCTWVCLAASRLVVNDACSQTLLMNGLVGILATVVVTHASCEMVAQDGCQVLGRLITCGFALTSPLREEPPEIEVDTCLLIAKTAAGEAVAKVLALYPNDEATMEQACYAAYALALDPDGSCQNLVSFGVLSSLPKVLHSLYNSRPVILWCLKAVQKICSCDNAYGATLNANGACGSVVQALRCHAADTEVLGLGLRVCTYLAQAGGVKHLFQAELQVVLVGTMTMEHPDGKVVEQAFLLISSVCDAGKSDVKRLLGQLGLCELSMQMLHVKDFKNSLAVICTGCDALSSLARDCPENNFRLGQDTCNSLEWCMDVMKRHAESVDVLIAVCTLLGVLAENGTNCARLGAVGACEEVLVALKRFPDTASLSVAACSCIGSLSCSTEFNQQRLSDAGACDTIVGILKHFTGSELICKWACRAIYRLAEGHPSHRRQFTESGGPSVLVKVFCIHASSPDVCEQCCAALSVLVDGSASNSQIVVDEGVCACLVASSMVHLKVVNVVISACKLICALSASNSEDMANAGVCEALLTAFREHISRSDVACHWCCRAVACLAVLPRNQVVLGEYKACEVITLALTTYVAAESIFAKVLHASTSTGSSSSAEDVALWASNAISQLAVNNLSHSLRLGTLGACEALVRVLLRYNDKENIVVAACRAMCILVKDHPVHAARLGTAGACHALVEVLIQHPGSEMVAGTACRVIKFMAQNKESNLAKLANAGACETVPVAIQAHQTSSFVASEGCGALAALAANMEYVKRMGYSGACEAIVFSMKRHVDNERLVERAARAMGRLALAPGNSAWLGPAGACEALMTAEQRHLDNEYIAAAVFGAMGNLAGDDNNRERLIQRGCCAAVVISMKRHPHSEDVCRMTARCIAKLTLTESTKEIFFAHGACEIIASSLDNHQTSVQVLLQLTKTVSDLTKQAPNIQDAFGSLDVSTKLIAIMTTHKRVDLLVIACCWALTELCNDHVANQCQCAGANLANVLLEMSQLYFSSEGFAEAMANLCRSFCKDNSENVTLFVHCGLIDNLVRLLAKHHNNLMVAFGCVHALRHILKNDVSVSDHLLLQSNGAGSNSGLVQEQLVFVASKYGDSLTGVGPELLVHASECMISLSKGHLGQQKLGFVAAPRVAVVLLQRHESTEVLITLSRLVAALSINCLDNQHKLVQSGVCKAVASTLDNCVHAWESSKTKQSRSKSVARKIRKSVLAVNNGMTEMANATVSAANFTASVFSSASASPALVASSSSGNNISPQHCHLASIDAKDVQAAIDAADSDADAGVKNEEALSLSVSVITKGDGIVMEKNPDVVKRSTGEISTSTAESPNAETSTPASYAGRMKCADVQVIEECCYAVLALLSCQEDSREIRTKFINSTDIQLTLNTIISTLITDSADPTNVLVRKTLEAVQS